MMRGLVVAPLALLLFALPAHALERARPVAGPVLVQYTPPDRDEDGCIALAEQMDMKAKAKRKPTAYEQEQFDLCVDFLNCEKAQNAGDTTAEAATANNETLIRFVLKTCTGYDPKPLTPGEKFMREKP